MILIRFSYDFLKAYVKHQAAWAQHMAWKEDGFTRGYRSGMCKVSPNNTVAGIWCRAPKCLEKRPEYYTLCENAKLVAMHKWNVSGVAKITGASIWCRAPKYLENEHGCYKKQKKCKYCWAKSSEEEAKVESVGLSSKIAVERIWCRAPEYLEKEPGHSKKTKCKACLAKLHVRVRIAQKKHGSKVCTSAANASANCPDTNSTQQSWDNWKNVLRCT